jgi:hypothetical protein
MVGKEREDHTEYFVFTTAAVKLFRLTRDMYVES